MSKMWDSGYCTICEKSLVGVDSVILDSGCYCPNCVQPKYQWCVIEYMPDGVSVGDLIGPFATRSAASGFGETCCENDWEVIQLTPQG